MLGVLVFDTLPGLFIGISISLLLLLYRASRPYVATLGEFHGTYVDITRQPEAERLDGIAIVRVEGGLYFANADAVRARLMRAGERRAGGDPRRGDDPVRGRDRRARCSTASPPTCAATASRLVIARDVGLVRDVLDQVASETALHDVYPSVRAAVAVGFRPEGVMPTHPPASQHPGMSTLVAIAYPDKSHR